MNRSGHVLSLLFFSVTCFLLPDHLVASSLRASEPSLASSDTLREPTQRDIDDILPPVQLSASPGQAIPWLFWGSLIVAVGTVSLLLIVRKKRHGRTSAHDPAMQALTALDQAKLRSRDALSGAESVATILREYVGHHAAVNSASLTTTEASQILRQKPLPAGVEPERLQEILTRCDHIKFSGFAADENTVSGLFDAARIALLSNRRSPS